MAIGLGLICGFSFPRNFNLPYMARSVTEFWRRWHMSLSRWFRDYVYIPLGGNRHGSSRTLFNLFLVFFLCGLWHGANWTFVVWGMLHGSFLVIERLWLGQMLARRARFVQHAYTLSVVVLAWVVFRANDFTQAAHVIEAMFGLLDSNVKNTAMPVMAYCSNTVILALLCAIFFSSGMANKMSQIVHRRLPLASIVFDRVWLLCLLLLCAVSLASGAYNPFIYFRF
jgi:alginate O-acetyltransferase complex protein AlgI